MRHNNINITLIALALILNTINAQTIWTGPIFEFEKEDYADPNNIVNQDSITPSVSLTRGDNGEIYNANLETTYSKGTSPLGTEWAIGDLSELESLTFRPFRSTVGKPRNVVGKKLVLYVTDENVYLSVEFTSWSDGKKGGFAYKRSTNNTPTSFKDKFEDEKLNIYPNPSTNFIQITGLRSTINYEIFDIIGSKIGQGTIEKNKRIEVDKLKKGIYFIRLGNKESIRFLKK